MRPDPTLIGWYYRRGGQHIGPVSCREVAHLLDTGALRPSDMLVEIAEAQTEAGPAACYEYRDAAAVARAASPAAAGPTLVDAR